ncbi:MAG: HAMP domain-containing sensor histidine kinase [Lactobacillus sp.]
MSNNQRTSQAKKNKKKTNRQETRSSSIVFRWMTVVMMTITVSFVIFSIVVYKITSRQSLSQQEDVSSKVVSTLDDSLTSIRGELQIANVVPALSPSTRRLLRGGPAITGAKSDSNAFNDDLVSSISNPDISVAVYNLHHEVVFATGNTTPTLPAKRSSAKVLQRSSSGMVLHTYSPVQSNDTGNTTGYIVVANNMSDYNHLMTSLLRWMVIISIVAILSFTIVSYFVVTSVVKPIKAIAKVARQVNQDPNSDVRIKGSHRHDELQDLADSFNQMLDRMQRYIEQQKEFVSDVSHELRTPVAVIEGHLSMLERWGKEDPEILNESINASLQEADRMKHLIQEMLDLTRAEQINVSYPYEVTNVSEVLSRVVNDLALVHKDFKLQLDLDDLPLATQIQIYRDHLEQLLVILVDNGIKYSTTRHQINISAGVTDKEVIIIVQDFGEGISKVDQAKIFNRFYRVDKARTREKGGNGLGLAIAQKLVTSYHGKIGVESAVGQGSQFKLTFPILTDKEVSHLAELKDRQNIKAS